MNFTSLILPSHPLPLTPTPLFFPKLPSNPHLPLTLTLPHISPQLSHHRTTFSITSHITTTIINLILIIYMHTPPVPIIHTINPLTITISSPQRYPQCSAVYPQPLVPKNFH